MKWRKASEKFPPIQRVIARLGHIIGYAECIDLKKITFEHCRGNISWDIGHEQLSQLEWLDESEPSPSPAAVEDIEKEANTTYPHKEIEKEPEYDHVDVTERERAAYIAGRSKSIEREKELEDHLKNIYEMYGDEMSEYAKEWTEKVLRIQNKQSHK